MYFCFWEDSVVNRVVKQMKDLLIKVASFSVAFFSMVH